MWKIRRLLIKIACEIPRLFIKTRCLLGGHFAEPEAGPYCIDCGKRLLPRGWFITEGHNGIWVVYDNVNYEPQGASKNAQKAINEALGYAKHLGLVY